MNNAYPVLSRRPEPYRDTAGERNCEIRCRPGKISLLYGPPPVFGISHRIAACRLIRGERAAVIDGANRFSPHDIARVARRHGADPEILLERVAVSRAFTCYQMEAAVTERAPAFIHEQGCSALIVLGPLDLFYDEQAPTRDVHRGLQRVIEAFEKLRERNVAVLLVSQCAPASRGRGYLFTSLKTHADAVYRLDIGEKHFALLSEKTE